VAFATPQAAEGTRKGHPLAGPRTCSPPPFFIVSGGLGNSVPLTSGTTSIRLFTDLMKHRLLTMALLVIAAAVGARAEDLDASAQEGKAFFDGAVRRAALAAQSPSPQDKARLLAELKKHVTINDRGVPAEGAALNAILARMMDSPTARELAAEFIKEDAKAVIAFEDVPGTEIFEINGKKTFWTDDGYSDTEKNPPEVALNSAYLAAQTENAPAVTAHELLGHVLERKRAERYGVAEVYKFHRNEEANAGLIGWTVGAELGNKITDGWSWKYMADPDDYHKRLQSTTAAYAAKLSTEEMKSPRTAYEKRLADIETLLLGLPARRESLVTWQRIIDHFIEEHDMDGDPFTSLNESLYATLQSLPDTEYNLRKIKEHLESLIRKCDGEAGKAWTGSLAAKADNGYFKEKARVMEERRQVLTGLMQGKTWESEAPPTPPGQISRAQLEELWEKDKASGCGGIL